MQTALREVMASGVLVEVCDPHGNCLAQGVYFDWRGRPLPAVGECMSCEVVWHATGCTEQFSGRVRCRQFDVQRGPDGDPAVWVRLVLEADAPQECRTCRASVYRARFSAN
jgi:hypothetical protein